MDPPTADCLQFALRSRPPLSIKRAATRKTFKDRNFFTIPLDPEPPAASGGWLNGGRQAATVRPTGEQADRRDQAAQTQGQTQDPKGNETTLTITGNLVDDPELRFTPSGQPVAKFHVASTPRYKDNATTGSGRTATACS